MRRAIKEQLAALMVLPNKFVFPLINNLSMKSIKFLQPVGAVRIEIIEAKHLKKADVGMLGLFLLIISYNSKIRIQVH